MISDGSFAYVHNNGPLAQYDAGNNRSYLLNDALHSVRGVSDGSGGLIGSASYDAFGGVRSQSGASSAFGFTGELYSPQTGLLHLRARDYQATMGRLLSADTQIPNAADGVGYNLYAYVANNPTRWADPSGHQIPGAMAMTPQLSEFGYLMMSIGLSGLELMRGAAGLFGGSMTLGTATFLAGFVFAVLAMLCLAAVDGPCYTASRVVVNALEGIVPCMASADQSGLAISNAVLSLMGETPIDVENCIPKPKEEKDESCQANVSELIADAEMIHSMLLFDSESNTIAYEMRTTAVLRATDTTRKNCYDYVAAGKRAQLSWMQTTITLALGMNPVYRPTNVHAEVKVLTTSQSEGMTPLAIGVSRNICVNCIGIIQASGGKIVSPRGAEWK